MDARTTLRSIKPDGMASEILSINSSYGLYGIENRDISNATPKRQNEFATGRAAARRALQTLSISAQSIPRARDRQPIWPERIVGSISHAEGFAAAIVGHEENHAGVGLDIEGASMLKKELRKFILTPHECEQRAAKPFVVESPRCKVSFIAKEALFKAVYPISRKFFGFQDAQVDIQENGIWTVALPESVSALPTNMTICNGRWAAVDDLIMATVCIKPT